MIKVLAVVVVLGATTERCSWGLSGGSGSVVDSADAGTPFLPNGAGRSFRGERLDDLNAEREAAVDRSSRVASSRMDARMYGGAFSDSRGSVTATGGGIARRRVITEVEFASGRTTITTVTDAASVTEVFRPGSSHPTSRSEARAGLGTYIDRRHETDSDADGVKDLIISTTFRRVDDDIEESTRTESRPPHGPAETIATVRRFRRDHFAKRRPPTALAASPTICVDVDDVRNVRAWNTGYGEFVGTDGGAAGATIDYLSRFAIRASEQVWIDARPGHCDWWDAGSLAAIVERTIGDAELRARRLGGDTFQSDVRSAIRPDVEIGTLVTCGLCSFTRDEHADARIESLFVHANEFDGDAFEAPKGINVIVAADDFESGAPDESDLSRMFAHEILHRNWSHEGDVDARFPDDRWDALYSCANVFSDSPRKLAHATAGMSVLEADIVEARVLNSDSTFALFRRPRSSA